MVDVAELVEGETLRTMESAVTFLLHRGRTALRTSPVIQSHAA